MNGLPWYLEFAHVAQICNRMAIEWRCERTDSRW
jgi:hypothetical protein